MTKAKKQADEPELHEDPILTDPPRVEVEGRTYILDRLGLRHTFRVARILGRGVAMLGDGLKTMSAGQAAQVIIASMVANEDEVINLLATVLMVPGEDGEAARAVTRAELLDASLFPMDSIITVVKALADHQDMKRFFTTVAAITANLPETQTPSGGSSSS